jgi:hypothetical protein
VSCSLGRWTVATSIAVAVCACAPSAPAVVGTRYENADYSVVVPDAFRLSSSNQGATMTWIQNQLIFERPADPGPEGGITVATNSIPCAGLPPAQALSPKFKSVIKTPTREIELRHLGANDVAVGAGPLGRFSAALALICAPTMSLTFLALNLDDSTLDQVLGSVVIRNPPGDRIHPPSVSPSN